MKAVSITELAQSVRDQQHALTALGQALPADAASIELRFSSDVLDEIDELAERLSTHAAPFVSRNAIRV